MCYFCSMKHWLVIVLLCLTQILFAQEKGILQGTVSDKKGTPISYVSVACEGAYCLTKDDGSFQLEIPKNKECVVYFQKIGFEEYSKKIILTSSTQTLSVVLRENVVKIKQIDVSSNREAEDNTVHLSAEKTKALADLSMTGIEGGLKTFAGVNSKSELSSQYSVRGGSYDENLVYVNGVPAFKPNMARSDKQEGLSIINPYMVERVDFSSGGFDICYGDKMSSVLNVTYKDVELFQLQADASLMDANVTVQGVDKNKKLSILAGGRYKNTSLVLKTLDESGEYKPIFYDVQSLLKYKISPKATLSYWIYGANNTYSFLPDKRVTDFGGQAQTYKMTIYFEGGEKYNYQHLGNSLTLNYQPTEHTQLDFKTLYYHALENENFDVLSQYRLSESFSNGETLVEDSTAILAVGSFLEHGRNKLRTNNLTCMHDGKYVKGSFSTYWGLSFSSSNYDVRYNEWTYIDSANYVVPYCDTAINLKNTANSQFTHVQNIGAAYLGFSKRFAFSNNIGTTLKLNAGIRSTYDTYSEQLLFNPRLRLLLRPNQDKSNRISFAAGIYYQPAEIKELIDKSGQYHTGIKPQKSTHFVLGYSQNLKIWDRTFFWNTELYAKLLRNNVPYIIDNVSITYYPELCADGYITGIDTKLNGEFVPGVESWINLSLMRAREHLQDNSSKEIRRANDQLVNFSMFFQDYLPGSERLKMNLTFMVGSNIPTAKPTATYNEFDEYKISSYTRLDIGFLYVLLNADEDSQRTIKNLSLGLEIFNLFDNANKISYFWIEDVSNRYFAVPNYLTSRRVNLKLSIKI